MKLLLADVIGHSDLEAMDRVARSQENRFDILVEVSGLSRSEDFRFSDLRNMDFCNSDLRGFNFTGSDLRGCIRNERTLIDKSTILSDAKIEWINQEDVPIVAKMQAVSNAAGSPQRRKLLDELVAEFGRTTHVVNYMVGAASKARNLDEFLDYSLFLPAKLSSSHSDQINQKAQNLLKRKIASSRSRTRRDKTSIFAVDGIIEVLKSEQNSLAGKIYDNLVEIVTSKDETSILNGMAHVDESDLSRAIGMIQYR